VTSVTYGNPAPAATPSPSADVTLQELAAQIREAHAAAGRAINNAVTHALTAGRGLITAQGQVKGNFGKWIEEHCDFSSRHARRYMALVRAYEAGGHSVSGDLLGLSLRGVIQRLTPPSPKPGRRRKSSVVRPRTGTGIDLADGWRRTPGPERTKFINQIGFAAWVAHLPSSFGEALERWAADRQQRPQVAPSLVEQCGDPLAIPRFLARTAQVRS
jgi:hypothetical protein